MDEKALLEAIRQIVREENAPIIKDVASLKQDVAEIKEDLLEVRDAQNYLIGWVDNLSKAVHTK